MEPTKEEQKEGADREVLVDLVVLSLEKLHVDKPVESSAGQRVAVRDNPAPMPAGGRGPELTESAWRDAARPSSNAPSPASSACS